MSAPTKGPVEFTLHNADGEPVEYVITLHGVDGLPIALAIGAEVGPALLAAIANSKPLLAKLARAVMLADEDVEIMKLLELIDLQAIGTQLRTTLADPAKSSRLVRDIMKYAIRDGQKMRDDAAFATAYRANWFELAQAVWRIVQENRFFPQPNTSRATEATPPTT